MAIAIEGLIDSTALIATTNPKELQPSNALNLRNNALHLLDLIQKARNATTEQKDQITDSVRAVLISPAGISPLSYLETLVLQVTALQPDLFFNAHFKFARGSKGERQRLEKQIGSRRPLLAALGATYNIALYKLDYTSTQSLHREAKTVMKKENKARKQLRKKYQRYQSVRKEQKRDPFLKLQFQDREFYDLKSKIADRQAELIQKQQADRQRLMKFQ